MIRVWSNAFKKFCEVRSVKVNILKLGEDRNVIINERL